MYIDNLNLRNFRNYKENKISFSKTYNVIYGENAQGKTNIIEAIFLCASGRSHRTSRDAELVNVNSNSFHITLDAVKSMESSNIEILYERDKKKVIKINEVPLKKIGNLMGNVLAVIFSPEDLSVISEGPSQRRRFIDITISQIKPSYFYDLQLYNKILLQRNSLLKELQNSRSLIDTLDVWDEKLSETGSRIIKSRHEFINRLSSAAEKNHYILSDNNENMKITYMSSVNDNVYKDIEEIKENFINDLKKLRIIELRRCTTLKGPHRDDYNILINGMDVKSFGSQGQKRTVILSIKLSELQIIKEETGEFPVLLLDDVMSELDNRRREILFDNITHVQTFITCTEKDIFSKKEFRDILFVNVKNGNTITEKL
ncbi:MAG: DNA replication and repair protein RecF [Firmicutes bacterium ADurb.Bin419]|nr:MAG: DNA replication and repair protein RecF [Firmicutes bacterium ADurb.Bin419]